MPQVEEVTWLANVANHNKNRSLIFFKSWHARENFFVLGEP